MDIEDAHVGRRVREVRAWRGMNLEVTAGLAGVSTSYLSLIERGRRHITKRSLLESIASALRVSPADLTGKPYAPSDTESAQANASMAALADTLTGWWVGEAPDIPARPWPEVAAEVALLTSQLRPASDYATQAALLPGLILDLLVAAKHPGHRRDALVGLIDSYQAAANVGSRLGYSSLPIVAVERLCRASEELAEPEYVGYAGWARAHTLSGTNRARQYELAVAVTDDQKSRAEVRGMANLTAALACAAQNQEDSAETHLAAAAELAERIEPDVSPWGHMQFGRTNVGIWRVAIGVELGHGAKVGEIAAGVRPETITKSRASAFYIDLGRGLASERQTRDKGMTALLHAEKLAPQQFRNNVFVRETVADLLYSARREAGGRDLRYLAWRLGIAPTG